MTSIHSEPSGDMAMRARRSRTPHVVLGLVVTGSVAFFLFQNATPVSTALAGVGTLSVIPAVAGVVLSLLAIANRGLLNQAAHQAVGLNPSPLEMTRTSAVGFAANKLVRSGGASGLAVFLRRGRATGFSSARVAASCVIAAAASLVALGVLLAVTGVLLVTTGRLSGWWLAVEVGFALYGGTVFVLWRLMLRSQQAVHNAWRRMRQARDRVLRRSSVGDNTDIEELYAALTSVGISRSHARRAVAHAVASKVLGAAMLLAAALAVGIPLSLTDAAIIYAAALSASFVSLVPAGIGPVEATTGAMFMAVGAPVAVAAGAVAIFRILDLWLPATAGVVLGSHELRQARMSIRTSLPKEQGIEVSASTATSESACLAA